MPERDFDVVLHGATGFVGELTAHYLAEHAPKDLRWAMAGRNADKLDAVRADLAASNPHLKDLPLLHADSADQASLDALAQSTRVLLTTVGPYALHGEPLVRACAEHGTDYADLTGEPSFVDDMYVKYDAKAKATGARLIHCAGFDSIPADLGAYFTVLQLPENVPIKVQSRMRAAFRPSGGTFHSALHGFGHAKDTLTAARRRGKVEPKPVGRRVGKAITPFGRDGEMGAWVAPLPTIDQFIVERSAAALDRYGPDFRYGNHYAAKHLSTVVLGTAGVAGVFTLAQIPPLRKAMMKKIPPGTGPSPERRAQNWFRVEFVGEGGGKHVRTAISGGDGGYDETAKMLAEVALALVYDDLPDRSGQLTPVAAVGDALLERLPAAGIKLEVLDD